MHVFGGEDLSKKTDEETVVKWGKGTGEGGQMNVAQDFERVTAIVGKVRDAIVTIKDSDISIKNWHFAVDKMEKEYIVDFTIKLSVTPKAMSS